MSERKKTIGRLFRDQFVTTWPLFSAATVTVIFGWWVYDLASETVKSSTGQFMTRWVQFRLGEPNTMGDTLAGFIGSLTLIWVVASVIQQSMELRAQRREFAEMVKAQDAQVKALNAQAMIFEDEKRRRDEAQHDALAVELIEDLYRAAVELGTKALKDWTVVLINSERNDSKRLNVSFEFKIANDAKQGLFNFHCKVSKIFSILSGVDSYADDFDYDRIEILEKPVKYGTHYQIKNYSEKILEIAESCSPAVQVRIRSHYIAQLAKWYDYLFSEELFWNGDVTKLGQS